ncbi:MAG: glycine hydroxymethyltransferase [Chlamydiia bacterium]|nr:glycine hydroxymethyltransferase [Chlamydiia bacterium]
MSHSTYLEDYLKRIPEGRKNLRAIAFLASMDVLSEHNPTIVHEILAELYAQRTRLKLIASENYSSLDVQLAMGNLLTDKYAEGYPHHRFYAGCDQIDSIEDEASQLARTLFNCDYAYVQPHSGSDANLVALWSILVHRIQDRELEKLSEKRLDALAPEDYELIRKKMMSQKIMGLSLPSGGHLTHGYIQNLSSKMMQAVSYDVDPETETLNYEHLREQVLRERPLILLTGYSAYPRRLNFAKLRDIAKSVDAVLMVDMAHFAGLVAGGVFQGEENPIPYADIVTSTTPKTLTGPRGGIVLCTEEYAPVVRKGCPLVLGGPLPHVIAAKAVAFREALEPSFRDYAHSVVDNARALAQGLIENGIRVCTGGTDNHLVLVDVGSVGLTGRQAEAALSDAHIMTNRNMVPNDSQGPWYTSGLRLGTPALTSRGMGVDEMRELAGLISGILKATQPTMAEQTGEKSRAKYYLSPQALESYQKRVAALLESFPLYPELP